MKIKKIFLLVGVLFLILLLHWNNYTMPFERDEGEYAYSARLLLDGGLPYQDSFMQKPPMIIYTYALGQVLFGDGIWVPRMLLSITIFLIALMCGYIAKKEYSKNAGIAAMYSSVLLLSIPDLSSFAANTEIFMLLPLVGALWLLVKHRDSLKLWHIFWIAFLASTSILYKPISVFAAIFICLTVLWYTWQQTKKIPAVFKTAGMLFIGVLTSLLVFLGYFLIHDGGKSLWEAAFLYNIYYAKEASVVPQGAYMLLYILWYKATMIYIFSLSFILARPKRWGYYFALFIIMLVSISGGRYGHYFLSVMPFIAIMVGAGIALLAEFFEKHIPTKGYFASLVILLLILTIGSSDQILTMSPDQISRRVYGGQPFIESKSVANELSKITEENEPVYVAGSEPQILYYAKRTSSTRFVISYPLTINTPFAQSFQLEAIEELKEKPPKAIVVVQDSSSGLFMNYGPTDMIEFLYRTLNEKYTLVGGYLWTPELGELKGQFKKDLTPEEVNRASILLYKEI